MKTSQFIREAVDSFLWNGVNDGLNTVDDPGIAYLCLCFETYGKQISYDYKPLCDLIQEHVRCCRISENRWGSGNWATLPVEFGLATERIQASRFMFAEFLALSFEDIGD